MPNIAAVSIYHPIWHDSRNRRALGHDEDEVTAAIAAVRGLSIVPSRIVLVSQAPEFIEADVAAIIAAASRPGDATLERRLGGPAAATDALLRAEPGTAVVAVSCEAPAVAVAVLVGTTGPVVSAAGAISHSLPIRVHALGQEVAQVYDDPRLLRERGWLPAVKALASNRSTVIAGANAQFAKAGGFIDVDAAGPVAALLGIAKLLRGVDPGRLIALEGASASAADVAPTLGCAVTELAVPSRPLPASPLDASVQIPISLAAYERAFTAKLAMEASVGPTGALEFPPREWCPVAGGPSADERRALPRTGSVYTVVTVRIPVPGVRSPYSIAIVDLDGVDLRVMAPVTDVPAGETAIGDRGSLVLRRVAIRSGIPDYGYSFQPTAALVAG